MHVSTFRLTLLAGSMLAAAGSSAAFAQDAAPAVAARAPQDDAAASSGAGDIIVTAQRREQRLQDVPVSVSVTTGEKIQQNAIRDLVDLSQRVPGVKLGQQSLSDVLTIRGIGSGFNAGFEQAVGTFVDGSYRGRSRASRGSLFDVERVEVLKGPQTTFFGNNTIAGALNITSRKPSQTFSYNATALYAPTDGEYVAEGGITTPITDTLSARAAVKFSGMSGYIYNNFLKQHEPKLRDWIGRVSLRWEPSDGFRSDLRFDRARNRDKGTYSAEIAKCPPGADYGNTARGACLLYITQAGGAVDNSFDFRSATGASSFDLDMSEVAWTNRLDMGPVALTSITTYLHLTDAAFIQAQAVPVPGVGGTLTRSPFKNMERYENYSQELRLESQGDEWLQYVLGAYYSHGDLKNRSFSTLYGVPTAGAAGAPVTNAATPISTNRNLFQIDQTRSVFGQLTGKVTDQLSISGALRYTSVKKKASRTQRAGIGTSFPGPDGFTEVDAATEARLLAFAGANKLNFVDPQRTYNKLMPSANMQYKIGSDATIYATYSKGFKAGGYSDSNTPAQFDSEFVDAYEIGIKGTLADRAIFYALNVFQGDYDNLQEAITTIGPTGVSITTVGNAAKARSRGVEFSGSYRISPYVSFSSDLAYIDAKYLSYTNGQCTGLGIFRFGATCIQNLSGRPRAFSPKFSGTVAASLGIPLGNDSLVKVDPSLYVSTGYFLSPQIDPDIFQKRHAKADLRISYGPEDRHWEVAVIGKNLTDAKVLTTAGVLGTAAGSIQGVLDRGRSIAFSLSIRH